jgi:4-alpha-glucanotransferase
LRGVKTSELRELAKLLSIQLSYEDAAGKTRTATRSSLESLVRARLGHDGFDDALRARRAARDARALEPVIVVWGKSRPQIRLEGDYELTLESGEILRGTLPMRSPLPCGYHTLRVGGREAALFAAPMRAHAPEGRAWGVFAPAYALHSRRTWGIGDLTDLGQAGELGGAVTATLPMNAIYADEDPSPYAPVSRLFWNELYLDVAKLPEYRGEPLEPLPVTGAIDYKRVAAVRRMLLETLAGRWAGDDAIAPDAREYAAFRARREGDESAAHYHLYVQHRMAGQMRALADAARGSGLGLYLDFPLGVHGDGYDAWRYGDQFVPGVAVGAPPDLFFTRGQNWGFPPPDPDAIRVSGHAYFRACIRHQLAHAGVLRIDHVMGLHRLFWIPQGMEAKDGLYVHYPADELFAILTIESQRARSLLVGEDLGTVPDYVPKMMAKHGVRRMYVVQYEIKPDDGKPIPPPAAASVASVNTHDMPTFAGFWSGRDIDDRLQQQLLDESGAAEERGKREAMRVSLRRFLTARGLLEEGATDTVAVLEGLLRFLGRSDAEIVLVNLEDLWLELEPQNVPGVPDRSWRQRLRLSLEETRADATVTRILQTLDQARREAHGNQT